MLASTGRIAKWFYFLTVPLQGLQVGHDQKLEFSLLEDLDSRNSRITLTFCSRTASDSKTCRPITKQKEVIKAQKMYACPCYVQVSAEKSSCAPFPGDIINGRTDVGGGSFAKLKIEGGGLHHNRGDEKLCYMQYTSVS